MKEMRTARFLFVNNPSLWNDRASSFMGYVAGTGYEEKIMKIMDSQPDLTVLDMTCGGRTLAVPMSGMEMKITAADFSTGMLAEIVQEDQHDI